MVCTCGGIFCESQGAKGELALERRHQASTQELQAFLEEGSLKKKQHGFERVMHVVVVLVPLLH